MIEHQQFALIGPGHIGLSLSSLLQNNGYTCTAVVSRTEDGEDEIREHLGNDVDIHFWDAVEPIDAEFILVAVPDDVIYDMGLQLASLYTNADVKDITFIHFSGIQDSGVLQPLRDIGHYSASLHPLQTVPSIAAGKQALTGCAWALEGDSEELCRQLVDALDGKLIRLTEEQKVPYHLAAVMASNLLVALQAMAIDIASEAGLTQDEFLDVFGPLIRQSLNNLLDNGPDSAISGPLKRADNSTIERHLDWLQNADEKYLTVYRELSHYLMEVLLAENVIGLQDVETLTKTLDDTA
jgi:predicted short-subunit dehydrogenase-like oxidoreductase (DUF2520 family)